MFPKELRCRLAKLRITSLAGVINSESIDAIREDLLGFALESDRPVKLLIDSPGGFAAEGLSLFDFILMLNIPILGIVHGRCMSVAVNVLQACTKRFATPHSWFLIHAISSNKKYVFDSDYGKEIEDQERILNVIHEQMSNILVKRTGKPKEEIDGLLKRGEKYGGKLCVDDAISMGLIDRVLTKDEMKLFRYTDKNISVVESMELI